MRRLIFALIVLLTSSALPSVASEEDSVTSDSLSFGASFPLTGAASPGISSYYSGISAYFSYVNDNGGIYGRKINFVKKDDSNIAGRAVTSNSELILKEMVLALISTAPGCASQMALQSGVSPGRRGIPNLFVDCFVEKNSDDSEQSPASTNYYSKVSELNQITILKSYADKNFPNQKIALVYQDDSYGLAISKIKSDPKIHCTQSFPAGSAGTALGTLAYMCSLNGGLKDGDLVFYSGSASGLGSMIAIFQSKNLNLKYFVNDDAFNQSVFAAMRLPNTINPEIYTVSSNSLISETSNQTVATFLSIAQKYRGSSTLDQRFLNGMNAGYIVSNLLGALGPDVTRERLVKAMDLYGAQFDALGLSERSQNTGTRFMPTGGVVVKNTGLSSEAVSEVMSVENGRVSSNSRKQIAISAKGLPVLVQKLPNSAPATKAPTPTPAATPSKTSEPTPSQTEVSDLDGEEEPTFGKISVKREKNKYMISISSNLPNENLQVRATKRGQRAISFKVATDDDGSAKFNTSRSLSGYQVALSLDGEILSSVKAL
ncbi:unannotated protein [freshwater metagenome]|uniref:Unannotated protein n=1 Tax=freshwater metagenome TaxID=449393 RepID=A0A6J5YSA9_9ZZZZ